MTSAYAKARRSFPDGVFGIRPGAGTSTFAWPDVNLDDDLMRHLMLDAAHLGLVVPRRDRGRLPGQPGVQAYRRRTAWPDPGDAGAARSMSVG